MDPIRYDGPVGKHGPYGTHTNFDGSPVERREVCGLTDWRGVKCTEPATAHLCGPHMKALAACMDLPPGQVAKTPPSALQEEVERLNRVLAAQVVDSLLLSWVGTSRARMAAVVEAFGEGRVSLRRAVELTAARRPEIAALNVSASPTPAPDEEEAEEPEGVGAGAPWDDDDLCARCGHNHLRLGVSPVQRIDLCPSCECFAFVPTTNEMIAAQCQRCASGSGLHEGRYHHLANGQSVACTRKSNSAK